MKDVTIAIYENLENLSPNQKRIAQFFLDNLEEIPFYTLTELAKELDSSEATILRFVQNIGFKGYPDLKKNIQTYIKQKITPSVKIRKTLKEVDKTDIKQIITHSINQDIESLTSIIPKQSPHIFEEIIKAINSSNRIFLIGFGVSESLVDFMKFRLRRLKKDVRPITKEGKGFIDEILDISENDIIMVFGFHRSAKELFIAMDYALQCNAKSIALTNDALSLLAEKATYVIPAKRGPIGILNSLVVPMSICHAIIVALAALNDNQSISSSDSLEELWNKYFT